MGVKNLWDILESCKKTLPLHHLQNKRLCIDLSCWMVQLQNVNRSHCALADKLHLRGLFHRLRALIALNCSLIFVTDGAIPAIKLSTYRRRLNLSVEDETYSQKISSSLRRNGGSDFSRMIKDAKLLGIALGIPCLDGIEEGEAQCALLNLESQCDGCFTADSDAFLFGARTVYRDICLGEGGYVVCYEMADIERKLGFGRNSLITLALILGSDYFPGVHGLGREAACQIVKTVDNDDILHKIASEGLLLIGKKKKKNKSKRGEGSSNLILNNNKENESSINGPGKEQLEEVINAYMKPKCHSAESEAVKRVLVFLPFQRAKLHEICFNFFGWSTKKTDEYILPKIAERDLRKFANLRSTSTEQGVRLPLDKMPVKCPVSAIIKRRSVHGIECFEVSWEQLDEDGLKTSIVPADLLESACPEKILEFVERKALGKKQNDRKQRAKKLDKVAKMDEVELQLKNLVLEIERDTDTIPASTRLPLKMMQRCPLEDMTNNKIRVDSSIKTMRKKDLNMDIIDLCSSPEEQVVVARCVSKHEEDKVEVIELIDSSESDSEALSPEHARKARELRSFLANL